MNKEKSRLIFERFSLENPNPKTELNYESVFELLVAVILSAQATDVSVNKSTVKLFAVANRPETILALGELKLREYIKTIGLFNSKSANIIKTCQILIDKYKGEVPNSRDVLESLPGVGRKTANVVLNTAFGEPTIAVDTHIFRVANRTGLAIGKTPLIVEKGLLKRIEKKYLLNAHHWLVLHGRYICVARKPKCGECLIKDLCDHYLK
jgi:endonuclease III